MRYAKEISKMIAFGRSLAELSVCKNDTNTAIIFPPDCTAIYAIGYSGTSHDSCYDRAGKCGCAHAEANALLKFNCSRPAIMFCITSPCRVCAELIINSYNQYIRYVFYDYIRSESGSRGVDHLEGVGITCTKEIDYDRLQKWRETCRKAR